MSERQFSIRVANDDDREDIIRLVSEMHGADITNRYNWLYRQNPHGNAVSWLAIDVETNAAVAVTSIFPRHVLVDGQRQTGSIGGDCYVSPVARRRGIATQLHAATKRDMKSSGIEFMYGPPVANNLGALLKAGSQSVANVVRHSRPLHEHNISQFLGSLIPTSLAKFIPGSLIRIVSKAIFRFRFASKGTAATGYTLEPVTSFGAEWDSWYGRNAPTDGVSCVRDAAYLNFRYAADRDAQVAPYLLKKGGDIAGMMVIETDGDDRIARIVDLYVSRDDADLSSALRLSIELAIASGCVAIEASATPNSSLTAVLKAEKFEVRDKNKPWVFQVLVADGNSNAAAGRVTAADAWYFFSGDRDAMSQPPDSRLQKT